MLALSDRRKPPCFLSGHWKCFSTDSSHAFSRDIVECPLQGRSSCYPFFMLLALGDGFVGEFSADNLGYVFRISDFTLLCSLVNQPRDITYTWRERKFYIFQALSRIPFTFSAKKITSLTFPRFLLYFTSGAWSLS